LHQEELPYIHTYICMYVCIWPKSWSANKQQHEV
jgi:hypothetical protein